MHRRSHIPLPLICSFESRHCLNVSRVITSAACSCTKRLTSRPVTNKKSLMYFNENRRSRFVLNLPIGCSRVSISETTEYKHSSSYSLLELIYCKRSGTQVFLNRLISNLKPLVSVLAYRQSDVVRVLINDSSILGT